MTEDAPARLSRPTLSRAAARGVSVPQYDLDAVEIGVVHFGPGAFFRAHQAEVYERLLASGDQRWGVCGVSLRTPTARDALAPQDGLYTLMKLQADARPQIIGALREVLVASEQPGDVLVRLAAPQTRIVALTVTEKGYHLDAEGDLNLDDPAILHDLGGDGGWRSPIGWLAAGLRRRWDDGAEPFLTLSCDNLSDNGAKLKHAIVAFARARGEPRFAGWIEETASFPNSMVDSITPATDDTLLTNVAHDIGLRDAAPVQRERFSQWVVEAASRPELAELAVHGVTLTDDIASYERMKLRLLNGAHSALAYLGLNAGLETIADTMRTPELAAFVEALMREDLASTVRPPQGVDLGRYIDHTLARFREAALRHRLAQIAMDGSVKLPIRLLHPAMELMRAGLPTKRIALVIAAWISWVVQTQRGGRPLSDPRAHRLLKIAARCSGRASDVNLFFSLTDIFSYEICSNIGLINDVKEAYTRFRSQGLIAAVAADG